MQVPVLKWTPFLGVGIFSLNQDHKGLIGSYNDLIETLVRNGGRRSFLSAFDQFRECAERHFAHEELVMRNIHYVATWIIRRIRLRMIGCGLMRATSS